jgi:hypothetical protein
MLGFYLLICYLEVSFYEVFLNSSVSISDIVVEIRSTCKII